MTTVTFLSRKHVGSGNFEYKYLCTCSPTSSQIISFVASANMDSANELARLDCESKCGEQSEFIKGLHEKMKKVLINTQSNTKFVVMIKEVTDDYINVDLCFGETLIIPQSVVKEFNYIGTTNLNESIKNLAEIEIDRETHEGNVIYEMAQIILMLNQKNDIIEKGDNKGLNMNSIELWVQCVGTACNSGYSYLNTEKDIIDYAFKYSRNCSVIEHRLIGKRQIRVRHAALTGTRCGDSYSGKAYFDVVLAP